MKFHFRSTFYILLALFLFVTNSSAHNKVVVVPLGGYDGLSNVVTVAKTGGDFNSVEAALESIDNATEDNPYLILVAPGTFFVTKQLELKSYVTISGSGQELTKLVSRISESTEAMIIGQRNSTISSLSISSFFTPDFPSTKVFSCGDLGCAGTKIKDVSITIDGSSVRQLVAIDLSGSASAIIESSKIVVRNSGSAVGILLNAGGITLDKSSVQVRNGEVLTLRDDSRASISDSVLTHESVLGSAISMSGFFSDLTIANSTINDRGQFNGPTISVSTILESLMSVDISRSTFNINNSRAPLLVEGSTPERLIISCLLNFITDVTQINGGIPAIANSDCSRPI